jgi:hypothetical protein
MHPSHTLGFPLMVLACTIGREQDDSNNTIFHFILILGNRLDFSRVIF